MIRTVGCQCLLSIILLFVAGLGQAQAKQVIGWLEFVYVDQTRMQIEAKIDTGADTSSIKAEVLDKFSVQGEKWIRFSLTDWYGKKRILERKIERYAKIKRKLAPSIRRPVIRLGICLGNIYKDAEVTLAQRTKFKYQMLIGRNYLRGTYLVDSAIEHSTWPNCPGVKKGN